MYNPAQIHTERDIADFVFQRFLEHSVYCGRGIRFADFGFYDYENRHFQRIFF